MWPVDASELEALQRELAARWSVEPRWQVPNDISELRIGGVFVASERQESGDTAWAAVAIVIGDEYIEGWSIGGHFDAPYIPGLLAAREGRLLQKVVEHHRPPPDVLLVNATGRDHPRRAGLALHLGAACGLPTIGVTDRPLLAEGTPLKVDDEVVGYWVRTHASSRPVVVHAGWRTDAETARDLVLRLRSIARTPEPLRQARRLARTLRAESTLALQP